MKLAVIGLWHQGIVGAACLADAGHDVVAVDRNAHTIETLRAGRSPIYEPGLEELLRKCILARKLTFTTEMAEALRGTRDVLLMIDTPVNDRDESDLSVVFATMREMVPCLEADTVMLVTAQVPVGTCDELHSVVRGLRPELAFDVAYAPENLRLGQALERFRKPPLPVLGAHSATALDRVEAVFAPLGVKWERVSLRTAEMAKHALNAFLATSVTFANELGNLCDEVGADGHRLAEVLRLEPRIGAKAMLFPGLGFSGGTLARDLHTLRTLGDRTGVDTPMLDGIWDSNQTQNRIVLRKIRKLLGPRIDGRRVAVLGLTYKPDTSTLRRSAALDVVAELVRQGARVSVSDPRADRDELKSYRGFSFFENPYEAVGGAEVLVLMTPWRQYKELNFDEIRLAMARPIILDTANLWPGDEMVKRGFTYMDIGRGRKVQTP